MTIDSGDIIPLYNDAMSSRRKLLWNGTVSATIVLSERADYVLVLISQSGVVESSKDSTYLVT